MRSPPTCGGTAKRIVQRSIADACSRVSSSGPNALGFPETIRQVAIYAPSPDHRTNQIIAVSLAERIGAAGAPYRFLARGRVQAEDSRSIQQDPEEATSQNG
jgi:hypothetical protein